MENPKTPDDLRGEIQKKKLELSTKSSELGKANAAKMQYLAEFRVRMVLANKQNTPRPVLNKDPNSEIGRAKTLAKEVRSIQKEIDLLSIQLKALLRPQPQRSK